MLEPNWWQTEDHKEIVREHDRVREERGEERMEEPEVEEKVVEGKRKFVARTAVSGVILGER